MSSPQDKRCPHPPGQVPVFPRSQNPPLSISCGAFGDGDSKPEGQAAFGGFRPRPFGQKTPSLPRPGFSQGLRLQNLERRKPGGIERGTLHDPGSISAPPPRHHCSQSAQFRLPRLPPPPVHQDGAGSAAPDPGTRPQGGRRGLVLMSHPRPSQDLPPWGAGGDLLAAGAFSRTRRGRGGGGHGVGRSE